MSKPLCACATVFFVLAGAAAAQEAAPDRDYPSRIVSIIVPYPAGGLGDILPRATAENLRGARPVVDDEGLPKLAPCASGSRRTRTRSTSWPARRRSSARTSRASFRIGRT
jgi:hypothetical protein